MIYPGPGSSGSRIRGGTGLRGGHANATASSAAKGVRNGRRNGKGKPQQVVQWKQRNVQEGIVIVDELQLSKLIKREPIQKFYDMDPEPFATGLFASVRRCRSRETGQLFAAKFSSRARYGEDCSAEIHHEIALLSLCSPSARVIGLHDVFETPAEVILVLEFAPGGDLQTIIDDNLVPFEADVVKFVRQLVEGLAYLHERKIAHLDIKPQNLVMMADFPDCDVKLCDFEISRVILEGTEIREILGTPDYVAPEILHYEPITMKADMWSLGVTTYVLLTGFSPFGGETDQETFCNISRAEVDFPEELFEDVSQEAQDFIKRLLVRDPQARPTAKECLRHKWLSKKIPRTTTPPSLIRQDSGPLPTKALPLGDNPNKVPRTPTQQQQQKNLRKYLSKSREALFEKVVQQQQLHQKNSLRKTTLLTQYHKTRRLCESQMSLVSKSRERLLMMDQHQMSPYFSRSREKLYGLRSLSKSHEVLDMCKTVVAGGQNQEGVGLGILKTLTRATTADLSTLLRQRLLGHGSSTTSINSSVTTDQDLDEPVIPPPPPPAEPIIYTRMSSTPNSVVQSPITTTTIEEMIENSSEENISIIKSEHITQVPALLSPKLLKETLKNQSKFGLFNNNDNKSVDTESKVIRQTSLENENENDKQTPKTDTAITDIITSEKSKESEPEKPYDDKEVNDIPPNNESIQYSVPVLEKDVESFTEVKHKISEGLVESKTDKIENSIHESNTVDKEINNKTVDENLREIELINKKNAENALVLLKETPVPVQEVPDTTQTEKKVDRTNVLGYIRDADGEASPEETEPRYTVAQLISAFNRHQEVITKTSLEVTMTTNDKDTKMAPLIFNSEKRKFPIGPNALRLFIPDIDITSEPPKRKQKRKYNVGIRFPERKSDSEDVPKETAESLKEMYLTEDEESFQSLESTSSMTGECDSLTNLSIPEEPVNEEECEKPENFSEESMINERKEGGNENTDSTNNNNNIIQDLPTVCTLVVEATENDKSLSENKENSEKSDSKFQLSVEVVPSYLRSGSLSSDTSVASSETSSTMSWEEITPPNTATPTSNKNEPHQWPQKPSTLSPGPKTTSRSRSPSTTRESWNRLCTGTYNRAMEKFTSRVNKLPENNTVPTDPNRRPNRKSLTLLTPPQVINPSEKVRRKSIPVIKQHS